MKIYDRVEEYVETPDDVGEYKMPEAYDMVENVNQEKRFSVAMQRYKDPEAKDKMNPFAEQEAWEEHQIGDVVYLKQTPTSFSMISLSVTYGLRYIFRKRLTWKKTMYLFQENRNCNLDPKIRSRLQMSISMYSKIRLILLNHQSQKEPSLKTIQIKRTLKQKIF